MTTFTHECEFCGHTKSVKNVSVQFPEIFELDANDSSFNSPLSPLTIDCLMTPASQNMMTTPVPTPFDMDFITKTPGNTLDTPRSCLKPTTTTEKEKRHIRWSDDILDATPAPSPLEVLCHSMREALDKLRESVKT
ncbi:hypothetical protein PCE1_004338 [Barthelona sp. PCE]